MTYSLSLEERRLRIIESGCCGSDDSGMDDGGEAPEPDTDDGGDVDALGKVLQKLKKKKGKK